jgi:hypothetical protein
MKADEAYAKAVDAWRSRNADDYQSALSCLLVLAKGNEVPPFHKPSWDSGYAAGKKRAAVGWAA